jgi:hypothetical protein
MDITRKPKKEYITSEVHWYTPLHQQIMPFQLGYFSSGYFEHSERILAVLYAAECVQRDLGRAFFAHNLKKKIAS